MKFFIFNNARLEEMAARTPASRDRYVDFLRAFSISVVVVGHWLSAMVLWSDRGVRLFNAVGVIPGLWVTTWVLQVMPLFFFVGGFSNLKTIDAFLHRGKTRLAFLRTRAARLLKPTSVFLGTWFLTLATLSLIFKETKFTKDGILVFGPLWFLAVYLGVIMATPVMRELHRRYRVYPLVILVVLIILVDLLHFWLKIPKIRWANLAFVWLFVHQLGFFYADGSLIRTSKTTYLIMALVGLAGLIALTNIGVYPKSMVGTGLEKVSNMNPPTVCIIVLTSWLVGVAMLLRDSLNRWLSRRKPWLAVIWTNSIIMTIYLWHLTAYAIALLMLRPFGFGREIKGTLFWWLQRPIWIIVPAIILVGLMGLFGRFERPGVIKKHEPEL